MTQYRGIDYSGGHSNIDTETGIRFGVISINDLNEWAWESFEADYGPPTCGHCGSELVEYDDEQHGEYPEIRGCCDYACEHCERVVDSQDAYGEEPLGHTLDDGEYKAFIDSHNDVMILKSPYYTYAQFCSPCAPGAGHLANTFTPDEEEGETDYAKAAEEAGFPKVYCLGHDWFDGDKAPYPVFRVSDGKQIMPDGSEVTEPIERPDAE